MNTNTGLLVVIVVLIIGFGAWWVTSREREMRQEESKAGIEINLPQGDERR